MLVVWKVLLIRSLLNCFAWRCCWSGCYMVLYRRHIVSGHRQNPGVREVFEKNYYSEDSALIVRITIEQKKNLTAFLWHLQEVMSCLSMKRIVLSLLLENSCTLWI